MPRRILVKITDTVYGFIWRSTTANNCNTYLIDGPTRILIDPGHSSLFDHVHKGLNELGLTLDNIGLVIGTHAHPDHIEAAELFKEKSALATLHNKDWRFLKSMDNSPKTPLSLNTQSIAPAFFLKEGDISISGFDFLVLHTPGHSPGSVSIYWPDQKMLFTGDLVFKGGLGRTDLPGGNGAQLKESIKRLAGLDVEWLLPGHGEIISGSEEIKANFEQVQQVWFNYL